MEPVREAHVEIYRSRRPVGRRKWRFRCRAANHLILTQSAPYVNVADAITAAQIAHPGLDWRVIDARVLRVF